MATQEVRRKQFRAVMKEGESYFNANPATVTREELKSYNLQEAITTYEKIKDIITINKTGIYCDDISKIKNLLLKISHHSFCAWAIDNQSFFAESQEKGYNLFVLKNIDYGDAFAQYGPVGVIMRMGDKVKRIESLTANGNKALVEDEKISDTILDLANYSYMAIMLINE